MLLSAKRVVDRPAKPYGLDMTDEIAGPGTEESAQGWRAVNVEFLSGEIENIPLARHDSVDVVISNCVINLSSDKDKGAPRGLSACSQARRAICGLEDVVVRGDVPVERVRRSMELWVGCIAGALRRIALHYVAKLAKPGFDSIDIEPTRVYSIEDAQAVSAGEGIDVDAISKEVEGKNS